MSALKIAFRNVRKRTTYPECEGTPTKRDDPRQGGEEAEVVVYQPRGVGLMHTRHKPSNPHYTHATALGRKCCLPEKAPNIRKACTHRHLS
jgi:hypothetical protein